MVTYSFHLYSRSSHHFIKKKKSTAPILGLEPSLLHVWLFLERDRAWKMWQLSINHRDAPILRASLACRFAEKRGGKKILKPVESAVAVGWMFNPFETSCMFTNRPIM